MSNNTPPDKPKVFIGSSTAGLDVANQFQVALQHDAQVTVWNQENWVGDITLNKLYKIRDSYDFFILIFRPDDKAQIRDEQQWMTRDNVLFEAGLFMGRHGFERTFIAFQKTDKLRVPTDLLGLNPAEYESESAGAIGPAATHIRTKIREVWQREKLKPSASADVDRIKAEAAMLYRILNSTSHPQYKAIDSDLLRPLNLVGDKSFRNIADVRDVVGELFDYYLLPHFAQSDAERMRVYFAYYLGDGAPFTSDADPHYCLGKDSQGQQIQGTFVIGISNSSHRFPEPNWRSGLPLGGYADPSGRSLSTTAEAFRKREAQIIADTKKVSSGRPHLNFEVADERTVYAVPVLLSDKGWSFRESLAPIGVLTISGSQPNTITPSIRSRADHLALLLGFIFYFHSLQNPDNPDVSQALMKDEPPVGLTGASEPFLRRALALRREVAAHFEEYFVREEIHRWENNELLATVSPS
jgi:hypothetical protein